jgi:allantoate deiminase
MRDAMTAFGLDPAAFGSAARKREEILAYAELHIEQGPVLEAEGLAAGVVTAINGFTRMAVTLRGTAGHAGTVPMGLRRDALAGAAECVLAVERVGRAEADLVATVGRIRAQPGAINVVPGDVEFTVDLRAPADARRERALAAVRAEFVAIAQRRSLELHVEQLQDHAVTTCAAWLMAQFDQAVAAEGLAPRRLPSGAGHDGIALRAIADIAMLFVRCKGGISHNPAESIEAADAAIGTRILHRFIEKFSMAGRT